MKISDTLLQQEGLSMAHDGATYCGTRGEYTFLILMGRNELVVSVLRGGDKLRSARKYALPAQDYPVKLRALRHGDGTDGHKLHTVRTAAERGSGIGADGKEQQRRERREHP